MVLMQRPLTGLPGFVPSEGLVPPVPFLVLSILLRPQGRHTFVRRVQGLEKQWWFRLSFIEKRPFKQRLDGAEGVNQGVI